MTPLDSFTNQATHPDLWFSERLPIGLELICFRKSASLLGLRIPAFEEDGLVLTFANYKGDLQIAMGNAQNYLQQPNSGLGLLSAGHKPLLFKSLSPVNLE